MAKITPFTTWLPMSPIAYYLFATISTNLKVPVVNPFFLPGRHRYIPMAWTLSPGYKKQYNITLHHTLRLILDKLDEYHKICSHITYLLCICPLNHHRLQCPQIGAAAQREPFLAFPRNM